MTWGFCKGRYARPCRTPHRLNCHDPNFLNNFLCHSFSRLKNAPLGVFFINLRIFRHDSNLPCSKHRPQQDGFHCTYLIQGSNYTYPPRGVVIFSPPSCVCVCVCLSTWLQPESRRAIDFKRRYLEELSIERKEKLFFRRTLPPLFAYFAG